MAIFNDVLKAYKKGLNINLFLKEINSDCSDKKQISDEIALSYDLQSGSYIKSFYDYEERSTKFVEYIYQTLLDLNVFNILNNNSDCFNICDFGTGEGTHFSVFLKLLNQKELSYNPFAMDISLSRLDVAREFLTKLSLPNMPKLFLGDLVAIPILDNAIDICISMNSIEPNRGNEERILSELIRVSRNYIVLAEPLYETASNAQKERMDKFRYIKELRTKLYDNNEIEIIHESLIDSKLTPNLLNRTSLIIAKKKKNQDYEVHKKENIFACPIEKVALKKLKNFWISNLGTCFPEINDFPIFSSNNVLAYFKQANCLNNKNND